MPPNNIPLEVALSKIAFRITFCLHNCPSDKWPQRKLPSRKIAPRINYSQDIPQESKITVL